MRLQFFCGGKNRDLDEPVNLEWDGTNYYTKLHHPHAQFQPKTHEVHDRALRNSAEYGDRIRCL